MTYTLHFENWKEPDVNNPEVIISTQKTITFKNDGFFTRNSLTDTVIPQNKEQFLETINVYLNTNGVTKI